LGYWNAAILLREVSAFELWITHSRRDLRDFAPANTSGRDDGDKSKEE
jgi:hypothetical protein